MGIHLCALCSKFCILFLWQQETSKLYKLQDPRLLNQPFMLSEMNNCKCDRWAIIEGGLFPHLHRKRKYSFSYTVFMMFLFLRFNTSLYISCYWVEPFFQIVKFMLHLFFLEHQLPSKFKTVLFDLLETCPMGIGLVCPVDIVLPGADV